MRSEDKGQNLILAVILIFILILTYSSIPVQHGETDSKKKTQARWILRPQLAKLQFWETKKSSHAEPEPADQDQEHEIAEKDTEHEAVEKEEAVTEAVVESKESSPEPEAKPKTEEKAAQNTESGSEGVILMNNPKYASHTKPIVKFTHQTHIDQYSKGCGDCHHDDKGKPLDLKPGDKVTGCIECHKETETVKGEKLKKPEKIMKYHKEALHANCIDCHKAYNIEKGDPKGKVPAPVSCKQCHN